MKSVLYTDQSSNKGWGQITPGLKSRALNKCPRCLLEKTCNGVSLKLFSWVKEIETVIVLNSPFFSCWSCRVTNKAFLVLSVKRPPSTSRPLVPILFYFFEGEGGGGTLKTRRLRVSSSTMSRPPIWTRIVVASCIDVLWARTLFLHRQKANNLTDCAVFRNLLSLLILLEKLSSDSTFSRNSIPFQNDRLLKFPRILA